MKRGSTESESGHYRKGMQSDSDSDDEQAFGRRVRLHEPAQFGSSNDDPAFADLEERFNALQVRYKQLAETHQNDVTQRDAEIRRLRNLLKTGQGGVMTDQEAQQKIEELTKEVQKLLAENNQLRSEISNLNFRLASKGSADLNYSSTGPAVSRSPETFESVRDLTVARAELRAKDQEISQLRESLQNAQDEIDRLRQGIAQHNDAVMAAGATDADKKKKRKGWFGTSSSKKKTVPVQPSPTLIVTDDMEFLQPSMSMMPGSVAGGSVVSGAGGHMENRPQASLAPPTGAQAQQIQQMTSRWNEQRRELNERIIELERLKARAEAEKDLLEKERLALTEKSAKQESIIDSFKTQQRIYNDPDRIPSTKALMLPLPPGGDEAERWRTVVQIQEAALRKVAIQKEELERQLKTLTFMHGETGGGSDNSVELLRRAREDATVQSRLLTDARNKVSELDGKLKEATVREAYLVDEIQRAKTALYELDGMLREKVKRQDKQHSAFVAMLGAALAENEILQENVSASNHKYQQDVFAMHGEVRALRQGRVGRMEGKAPGTAVFPSPPSVDMLVFRHGLKEHKHQDPPPPPMIAEQPIEPSETTAEVSESSASGSDTTPRPDSEPTGPTPIGNNALDARYYYEWTGGGYALREGSRVEIASRAPEAGPFPPDPATMRGLSGGMDPEERMRLEADAIAALRAWNAAPPRQPPRHKSSPPRRAPPTNSEVRRPAPARQSPAQRAPPLNAYTPQQPASKAPQNGPVSIHTPAVPSSPFHTPPGPPPVIESTLEPSRKSAGLRVRNAESPPVKMTEKTPARTTQWQTQQPPSLSPTATAFSSAAINPQPVVKATSPPPTSSPSPPSASPKVPNLSFSTGARSLRNAHPTPLEVPIGTNELPSSAEQRRLKNARLQQVLSDDSLDQKLENAAQQRANEWDALFGKKEPQGGSSGSESITNLVTELPTRLENSGNGGRRRRLGSESGEPRRLPVDEGVKRPMEEFRRRLSLGST